MLEALFELLFRVLKHASSSAVLRGADSGGNGVVVRDVPAARMRAKCPLLFIALEALGKYTHLISLEYFTDLLDVFQQLLACVALPLRVRLRCLLTVAEIMRAQGDALNVDRRAFFVQLHEVLTVCPLRALDDERSRGTDAEGADTDDDDGLEAFACATDQVCV